MHHIQEILIRYPGWIKVSSVIILLFYQNTSFLMHGEIVKSMAKSRAEKQNWSLFWHWPLCFRPGWLMCAIGRLTEANICAKLFRNPPIQCQIIVLTSSTVVNFEIKFFIYTFHAKNVVYLRDKPSYWGEHICQAVFGTT